MDGIRGGAVKWEQRWAASEAGNPLARRLQFNDTVSYFGTEAGWRVRAIFTWMRIVRAEKNRQARRRSNTWRANEQHRLHQLHERSQPAPIAAQIRRPYTWREQTELFEVKLFVKLFDNTFHTFLLCTIMYSSRAGITLYILCE